MIHSMTAFARCERQGEWGTAAWELRSVNHRYLEAGVRMPESVRDLEGVVRERLRTALKRGKVEAGLRLQTGEAAAAGVSLDVELARQVVHASREVDSLLYNPAPVSSMDVLRWPGVIRTEQADPETLKAALLELLDEAIIELLEARAREGAQLRGFIEERLAAVGAEVERVRTRVPEVLAAQRERLLARLEEVRAELDPARLEQEMVLLAQKMDVTEEMDRLGAHVKEVGRVLKQGGAVGRRLDFLMQELNREANTLGSKSQDAETTRSSVELKVLIEQMREQVQNIE
jgi:uncharacterized protein (TIGR00255 family)